MYLDYPSAVIATSLHAAARDGKVTVIKELLKQGCDPCEEDSVDGSTPLHHASCCGQQEVVRLLLHAGSRVCVINRYRCSPLHCAAGRGHVGVLPLLLEAGAEVDGLAVGGRTALFLAVEHGNLDCVLVLLQRGAAVDIPDETGMTPLCCAVLNNYEGIARMLMSKGGASVNSTDRSGSLPLHYAVRNDNLSLTTALIQAGSQKNLLTRTFESPVHVAVRAGHVAVLRLLVQEGFDVNLCERTSSVSPLHVAVNTHSRFPVFQEMLELLLQGGAVLNWCAFSTLETPLYRSLSLGKEEMCCLLMSHGADPNLASPFEVTALQRACQTGSLRLVRHMLSCGITWKRERWLHRLEPLTGQFCGRRELYSLLREWRNCAPPLQALCRIALRRVLQDGLEKKLGKITLPQKVRDYLLLRDIS